MSGAAGPFWSKARRHRAALAAQAALALLVADSTADVERSKLEGCIARWREEPTSDNLYYLGWSLANPSDWPALEFERVPPKLKVAIKWSRDDLFFALAEQVAGQLALLPEPKAGWRADFLSCTALSNDSNYAAVRGRESQRTSQFDRALDHGRRAHERATDDRQRHDAAWCAARAALAAGRAAEAEEWARRALALSSDERRVDDLVQLADALRWQGRFDDALQVLDAAAPSVPCQRAQLELKRALIRSDTSAPGAGNLADLALERAQKAQCPRYETAIKLNQAERAAPDDALQLLDALDAEDRDDHDALVLRAAAELNLGHLDDARTAAQQLADLPAPDKQWEWERHLLFAEIARERRARARDDDAQREELEREELEELERAMQEVDELRAAQPELDPTVVASHRAPYEALIEYWAQRQRWRDALEVLLKLDASALLAELGPAREPLVGGPGTSPAGRGALPAAPEVSAVLAAWRGREVAMVVAPAAWRLARPRVVIRLEIRDGEVAGETFSELPGCDGGDGGGGGGLASWALRAAHELGNGVLDQGADRRPLTACLGQLLVPAPARAHPGTLELLLVGPLARIPLAELTDDEGTSLLARRPLAEQLSLVSRAAPSAAAPRTRGDDVVLYGPPETELDDMSAGLDPARGAWGILGDTSLTAAMVGVQSAPATEAALRDARSASFLYFAGHYRPETSNGPRKLWLWESDRGLRDYGKKAPDHLDLTELTGLGLAPAVAMLITCEARASEQHDSDPEGWESLAAVLSAAGAGTVIASDRTLADADALVLVFLFFTSDRWREDPVAALARAQAQLHAYERQKARCAAPGAGAPACARSWAHVGAIVAPPQVPGTTSPPPPQPLPDVP